LKQSNKKNNFSRTSITSSCYLNKKEVTHTIKTYWMILYRIFLSSLMKTISNQSKFQKNSMYNNNPKFSSLKSDIIMSNKLTLVNMKKIRVRNSNQIIYLILIWKVCPTSLLSKKIRILTPMSTLRICLNKISYKMNNIQ
jgi:hypothetical protein